MSSRRRLGLLAVAALAALVATGCIRFNADLILSEDDTVSGNFVVAVKEGTGGEYGMTDREFAEAMWVESPRAATLGDTRISDYSADGYRGITVRFSGVPLEAFAPTESTWGVTRDGDFYVVSGPSEAASSTTDDAGDGSGGAFTGDIDELTDAQVMLSVTFPGDIAQSNGDVKGRTVTWDLQRGPEQLSARGSAIAPSDPAVAVAYVVCGLLALGGVAYVVAGRRARSAPPHRSAPPASRAASAARKR